MKTRDQQFRALYRRMRIDDQRAYYAARAREYRAAHDQVVLVRNALLMAAAVAGVVSQAVHGTARAAWAVGAAVLGALAGAVTAYESLIGFPQLAKLYSDAERNLEEAGIDWDEPGADLAREIERVEWVFRSERGQWGQLVVKAASATDPAGEDRKTDAVDEDVRAPRADR
ncbi:SLATT domain-containing protein [Pseudonocardia halophobica]|uniref:SLATT domain-containing protein n=1 Tax=Pseudonocardia halophobica TaxID=29401 RepID=UPI003D89F51B